MRIMMFIKGNPPGKGGFEFRESSPLPGEGD